jgi:hypothetical protein
MLRIDSFIDRDLQLIWHFPFDFLPTNSVAFFVSFLLLDRFASLLFNPPLGFRWQKQRFVVFRAIPHPYGLRVG